MGWQFLKVGVPFGDMAAPKTSTKSVTKNLTPSPFLTPFCKEFGLAGPLVVAPMAGGPTTPQLVAATCNAGALGSLAGAYLSPADLRSAIHETRTLTSRPFAVNLFAPCSVPPFSAEILDRALAATRPYRQELGLPDPVPFGPPYSENFEAQMEVVLEEKPAALSFVFGVLEKRWMDECHRRGIFTIGAATTLDEGLALENSGVKALVAQGVEAGGHRSIFSADAADPQIGALDLTRSLAKSLHIPVIAAGGIMNGRDIAAALQAGAQAAQLGTAFLLCHEAGTSSAYRKALKESTHPTHLTRVFSGRLARGLENRFLLEMEAHSDSILPFPAQNALTRDLRKQATHLGKAEYLSLWAGTEVAEIREDSVQNLVQWLFGELALSSLQFFKATSYNGVN